ncbi:NAD(P)-dependent alcohol dehydrogenase [Sanguibacter sp. YZGR15]|uniref:NAD(P)-dependent alcohol dehydrogenase n=2 Tax=Sanguibacter suaedae TaxID=2795737 RepID=A0A934I7P7_9MICO|nr:NAD(P)-dependent alcohol dehydrogenase [Sanguibacter suaedae]
MKAIVQDVYGGPDVLELRDVPVPVPADDEVLVRVRASSVNAADWHLMRGKPYFMRLVGFGIRTPTVQVRGIDVAGVVEAVGSKVSTLRPGDEVYGHGDIKQGTFSELAAVKETNLSPKPATLSFEEAGAVPLAALTALQGVRDSGGVKAGHRVLINGASGGVGTFAVQIAKALGAEVTAVCSTRNVELVRSLGADHVVDYTRDDFTRAGERYDVVFDLVANRSLTALRRALAPRSTLVLSGGGGGRFLGPMPLIVRAVLVNLVVGQRLTSLSESVNPADLAYLADLIEKGEVRPVIDRSYPLAETAAAIRQLEDEHARGKIVITL